MTNRKFTKLYIISAIIFLVIMLYIVVTENRAVIDFPNALIVYCVIGGLITGKALYEVIKRT